ncbi:MULTISPECIES: hypothetical protein [unclassified Bradyrhizobium]|uniref:hypothetical protein n=1 Tax=unclassified Bradyrhizobium TaxID=2631580 RepID=UPI0029168DC6|nr:MULTISPECIES: hypothetical protein [unclassified Bradyrhizobium]
MTVETRQIAREKADRALALHEKGLTPSVIGERLGVDRKCVPGMIQRAKQRREKMESTS